MTQGKRQLRRFVRCWRFSFIYLLFLYFFFLFSFFFFLFSFFFFLFSFFFFLFCSLSIFHFLFSHNQTKPNQTKTPKERDVSPDFAWNEVVKNVMDDPRYTALSTQKQKKNAYNDWAEKKRRRIREVNIFLL